MLLQSVLFAVVLIAALSFFGWNVRRLLTYLRVGRKENRFDKTGTRIANTLKIAFGQSKLLREPIAGVLHFLIFWGFIILLAAVVESIGEGFTPEFSFSFLGPSFISK